jgi:hypothetical protein
MAADNLNMTKFIWAKNNLWTCQYSGPGDVQRAPTSNGR